MISLRVKISVSDVDAKKVSEQLENKCKVNKIKNGLIIEPNKTLVTDECHTYQVPKEIKDLNSILLIDLSENGGYDVSANKKQASIVCGLSSKALRPYFIPRKNVEKNSDHAWFSIPESCIQITANDENVEIVKIDIEDNVKESEEAKLKFTSLYNGHVDQLTEDVIRFKQAAEIAVDKANSEDCVHVYYFDDNITKAKPNFRQNGPNKKQHSHSSRAA